MNSIVSGLLLGFGLSIVTVLGDLLIKEASLHKHFEGWRWLLAGAVIYGTTALGWFYLLRKHDLSSLGVVYSLTTILALFVIGVFVYKDRVHPMEVVGLILGVISLLIIFRYDQV